MGAANCMLTALSRAARRKCSQAWQSLTSAITSPSLKKRETSTYLRSAARPTQSSFDSQQILASAGLQLRTATSSALCAPRGSAPRHNQLARRADAVLRFKARLCLHKDFITRVWTVHPSSLGSD